MRSVSFSHRHTLYSSNSFISIFHLSITCIQTFSNRHSIKLGDEAPAALADDAVAADALEALEAPAAEAVVAPAAAEAAPGAGAVGNTYLLLLDPRKKVSITFTPSYGGRRGRARQLKKHQCADCQSVTYLAPWCAGCADSKHGVEYRVSHNLAAANVVAGGLYATRDFNVRRCVVFVLYILIYFLFFLLFFFTQIMHLLAPCMQAGEVVAVYHGTKCNGQQLGRLYGKDVFSYALETKKDEFLDASANRCWGALVNDGYKLPGGPRKNLKWSVQRSRKGTKVSLKTTRAVSKGTEFFVSYGGKAYWGGTQGTFTLRAKE